MLDLLNKGNTAPLLKRIGEATQRLLGDTIALSDDDWRGASLLPGWSRAHVATHLARGADALRAVMAAALDGQTRPLYPSAVEKVMALERGAERSGLDLQIDLDTSAGEFNALCDTVTDWLAPVSLSGGEFPMSVLLMVRLQEVMLHHLDLDCGFTWAKIDLVPARWLLQWLILLLGDDGALPVCDIESDSGVTASFGSTGDRRTVTGPDAALWAWLAGRSDGGGLEGAEGLTWPLAG